MKQCAYHGPPKSIGYTLEIGVLFGDLGKVDGRAEQDDTDEEEENEQTELAHGRTQSLAENLKAFGMTR